MPSAKHVIAEMRSPRSDDQSSDVTRPKISVSGSWYSTSRRGTGSEKRAAVKLAAATASRIEPTTMSGQKRCRCTTRGSVTRQRRRGSVHAGSATVDGRNDLRSTFASNALAAGVTVFEFARVMGTSVRMIEQPATDERREAPVPRPPDHPDAVRLDRAART